MFINNENGIVRRYNCCLNLTACILLIILYCMCTVEFTWVTTCRSELWQLIIHVLVTVSIREMQMRNYWASISLDSKFPSSRDYSERTCMLLDIVTTFPVVSGWFTNKSQLSFTNCNYSLTLIIEITFAVKKGRIFRLCPFQILSRDKYEYVANFNLFLIRRKLFGQRTVYSFSCTDWWPLVMR